MDSNTQADATAESSSTEDKLPVDPKNLKVGILYLKSDEQIAQRIKRKINEITNEVEVVLFHEEKPAGVVELQFNTEMVNRCDLVLWIGTEESKQAAGVDFHAVIHGFHKALSNPKKKLFAFVQPEENLDIKPPEYLEGFTSLKEDKNFDKQIKATFKYHKKKLKLPTDNHKTTDAQLESKRETPTVVYNYINAEIVTLNVGDNYGNITPQLPEDDGKSDNTPKTDETTGYEAYVGKK